MEAIIVLPRELFITLLISVLPFWILNQNKKAVNITVEIFVIVNMKFFYGFTSVEENPVKGENKKKVRLVTEQIERAADIYTIHGGAKALMAMNCHEVPELCT